jgi:hypothetical protein
MIEGTAGTCATQRFVEPVRIGKHNRRIAARQGGLLAALPPTPVVWANPPACATPLTTCGAGCRDTTRDVYNCGACANHCDPRADCVAGVCTFGGAADLCRNARLIQAAGTYMGATGTTSRTSYLSNGCGSATAPEQVFEVVAGRSGNVTASTCGASWDTVLYVTEACGCGRIACNNNAGGTCGSASTVTWSAVAGRHYWVVVDGSGSAFGTFGLQISGL